MELAHGGSDTIEKDTEDELFNSLDRKTKELIAIAASLGYNCEGCLEGHIKKAIEAGATRKEISEAVSISMGVAAASVVDQTDIVAAKLKLDHFS